LQGGTNGRENNGPPLRILRRITYGTVDEVKKGERLKDERGLDLEPSVYLVSEAIENGAVRMHAEHLSVLSNAPNNQPRWHVNASQFPHKGLVRQLGETKFVFTQQAHACLTLTDEADVDAFAAAVLASLNVVSEVSMPAVRTYARERYDAGDAEWRAFIDGGDLKHQKDWGKWLKKA
jgi:hypothetical protein